MQSDERLDNLKHSLFRVAKVLVFHSDPESPLLELPISQMRCLRLIGWQEGEKMIELAARFGVKLPAMSLMVDKLVRKGYIMRVSDATDRRIVRLYLTDTAKSILKDERSKRDALFQATVERLNPDSVNLLIQYLNELAEAAEKAVLVTSPVQTEDNRSRTNDVENTDIDQDRIHRKYNSGKVKAPLLSQFLEDER